MADIKDGGPAFPRITAIQDPLSMHHVHPKWSEVRSADGMSLRDYFIAHAPVEPQDWFKVADLPAKPTAPVHPNDWTAQEREAIAGLREGFLKVDMVTGRALTYWLDKTVYEKALRAWGTECMRLRAVQWPGAWADAQLAERNRRHG